MAGISQKEYNEMVDESLVLFGGGAPCCNIDARLWGDFKELYKEFNDAVPKSINWSFDQVTEWLDEYHRVQKEKESNK
jgi:aromatic ring-opening dioxygenase catalytic subunit (LigB family)